MNKQYIRPGMSTVADRQNIDISKYERVRSLGSGAFCDVILYRLKTGETGEPEQVAIKMSREDHSIQDKRRDIEYLQSEAEVLKTLAADEVIVTLYYSGPHPLSGEPCLALEAFTTEAGWQRLDKIVPDLNLGEALRILQKIVQLLKMQQKKGIINPDLKLDSFFVQLEPRLVVKATDFNTTVSGTPDSPLWQKVRRALAEIICYLLSRGNSNLFLAFTHDKQPGDEEIKAEEARLIPPMARGLVAAALKMDFDQLNTRLQDALREYNTQFNSLIEQALNALEKGERDNAQGLLWDEILREIIPKSVLGKAKEQMLQGNIELTLDLTQNLPSELKGVPWLTVWAHLGAPSSKSIEEREKSEPNYFAPLYHHFLNSLKAHQMAGTLCSLLLLAPLPYDGSFASWIEQREQKDIKQCRPIYKEIGKFNEQFRQVEEEYNKIFDGLVGIWARISNFYDESLYETENDYPEAIGCLDKVLSIKGELNGKEDTLEKTLVLFENKKELLITELLSVKDMAVESHKDVMQKIVQDIEKGLELQKKGCDFKDRNMDLKIIQEDIASDRAKLISQLNAS